MRTKEEIKYKCAPYGYIATIPKGTLVVQADNLPNKGYWVVANWDGITESQLSWGRNYGFHVDSHEVESD